MRSIPRDEVEAFRDKIFGFYDEHGRELPWRRTTNRYRIWVSEVMLQQTQVSRVVPKYKDWIDRWPSVSSLAAADLQEVLSLWKGLGYNNRPKWLRNAAQTVVDEFDGEVPGDVELLQELKGIGPYTARAIRIFADNADIVTVDTNIRRIFIHEFDLDDSLEEDDLYPLAERLLPEGDSRRWHNALMDYGALEATSRKTGVSPTSTQSSFEGSRRYFRGQILDRILEEPCSLDELEASFSEADVEDIVQDLVDEGMLAQDGSVYRFAD